MGTELIGLYGTAIGAIIAGAFTIINSVNAGLFLTTSAG